MSKLEIPKVSDNPDYKAEAAKHGAIRQRIGDIEERLAAAQAKMTAIMMAKDGQAIDGRAEEIIQGKMDPVPEGASATDIRADIHRLETELKALKRARGLQKEKLDAVVSKVSEDISLQVLPAHKKAVAAFVDSLLAVDAAAREVEDIRRELEKLGYTSSLPAFRTPPTRFPLQPTYRLDGFIADARKYTE